MRKYFFCKFLEKKSLDVFCFQEVLPSQLIDITSFLPNYSFVATYRGKSGGESVPVFFKKDKYECERHGTFWLSENPNSPGSIGWDGKHPRIATWVLLKEISSEIRFYVINTHLDQVGSIAREKGIVLIKDSIAHFSKKYPAILTGDFNCSEDSNVYHFAGFKRVILRDAFDVAILKKGEKYTFHNFGRIKLSKRKRIDFIFVTDDINVNGIEIPKEIPLGGVFLSDHNPVIVELSLPDMTQ